jgi:hypothetical protein
MHARRTVTDDIPPEHARYARWLHWSGWLGLAVLVGAFVVYAMGLVPPVIPLERLPELWKLSSQDVMQLHGLEGGWHWIRRLDRSDMLNMLGIAILAGCSALPLLAVTPIYLRRGDRIYAALCVLVVAVLVLAASGVISTGH